jgi:ABC transporter substrate binding protein
MRRRDFITLLGGAAAAWPLAARAQQTERMRRIGVLMQYSEGDSEGRIRAKALEQTLQKLGWREGRNLQVDYRWADGDGDRFRAHAAELVRLGEDAIVAVSSPAVRALQRENRTIPIIFTQVSDPVAQGIVENMALRHRHDCNPPAGDNHPLASHRVSGLLALAVRQSCWQAENLSRTARAHWRDEPRKSSLGCATHSW